MRPTTNWFLSLALCAFLAGPAVAADSPAPAGDESAAESIDAFAETLEGLERRQGLLTVWLDHDTGRVWLEIPAAAFEEPLRMLYVEGLVSGLGSNPVGLDRGQLGQTRLVRLRPVGGKLLVEQENLGFRALSDNPAERLAVERSFATSVLWAGAITARSDEGSGLVDFTSFIVRDAHEVEETLERTEQGAFTLDAERSAVDLDACLAFPDNLELEAVLTYAGKQVGEHVRGTAPMARAVTLVQHHSLIRLPDDGYVPRPFDPRAGSFAIAFADYASALDQPLVKRWIVRHRLEKTRPGPAPSPVVEPIVYHVDPGAPQAIRQALVDGASWWARAFEEAGFLDAFRVELLPEDAHPLDVRYNVIQWVHRSTRGWSYGGGVVDPRSGEMIKGHVTLGSLRVRQDRLIFEGLAGAAGSGSGEPDDPVQLALARIRQLSAHEVGHTLGLAHNFAASTYGRASVMDYPAPLVTVGERGELDFGAAYGVGVGAWDVHAIRYAYAELGDEAATREGLEEILREGRRQGLVFVTDRDARPAGAAHPLGNLWDNGSDPVEELRRLTRLRRIALAGFDLDNLAAGRPVSLLQETLVPVYFLHRFQILAAAKVLGGLDYRYAVNGESDVATGLLDPAWQRGALEALLDIVEPSELDLREELLELLAPRPFGYGANRELMASAASPAFDALEAAATLTDMTVSQILQPERLARLVDQHRRDAGQPGLEEVLSTLLERIFTRPPPSALREAEISRVVQQVTLDRLLELARSEDTVWRVRYRVEAELTRLRGLLSTVEPDPFRGLLLERLNRFAERRETASGAGREAAAAPPGQPIGARGRTGVQRASAPERWLAEESAGCSWTGFGSEAPR